MKRKLERDWRVEGIILLIENLISNDFKDRMDFLGSYKYLEEFKRKSFQTKEDCLHFIAKEVLRARGKYGWI